MILRKELLKGIIFIGLNSIIALLWQLTRNIRFGDGLIILLLSYSVYKNLKIKVEEE